MLTSKARIFIKYDTQYIGDNFAKISTYTELPMSQSEPSSVTRWLEKNLPTFRKSSQNCCRAKKCQNINIIAQSESPKHLHQTTF
jgi:hypothetical protein